MGAMLLSIGEAQAQMSEQISDEKASSEWSNGLVPANGVNAGFGASPGQQGLLAEVYFDVPIASIYFSPALRFLFIAPNSIFSPEVRIKWRLWSGSTLAFFSFGGSVMTWEDRASIGIPVDLSLAVPLFKRLEFVTGANVTPYFFLGPEKDGSFFGVYAGFRVPVI